LVNGLAARAGCLRAHHELEFLGGERKGELPAEASTLAKDGYRIFDHAAILTKGGKTDSIGGLPRPKAQAYHQHCIE
jgi:hypothetical protein